MDNKEKFDGMELNNSNGGTAANGKPKEKRRNNEKRKEKSRDAARCRRSRETEIFTELAQVLPLRKEDVNQLDKASIMRVAIAYLKVREMLQMFPKIQQTGDEFSPDEPTQTDDKTDDAKPLDFWKKVETGKLLTQTLDGFLIILSNDGDVTYVTENITEHLGIAKIDILGQQIWEYSHQCDHADIKEALNIKKNNHSDKVKEENLNTEGFTTDHRDFFVRLKCTLTSRGRSVNIKSASYKVIHFTGHLVVNAKGDRILVAVGSPIPHPSNIEIPLGTTTFLTKHSLDMKFTYVDDKMFSLFGYKPEDLLDQSLFECHHGVDSDSLMSTFKSVLSKGQGETCRYRFLGKTGGYCWIVTQATTVYDKQKPQSIVCVNYVISYLENSDEIYSLAQYEASKQVEENNNNITSIGSDKQQEEQQQQKEQPVEQEKLQIQQELISAASIIEEDATEIIAANGDGVGTLKIPPLLPPLAEDSEEKSSGPLSFLSSSPSSSSSSSSLSSSSSFDREDCVVKRENILITKNIIIDNSNKVINKSGASRDSSLSPLRRKLQSNCSIGNKQSKIIVEEKRPKSVTASVFRVADSLPSLKKLQSQLPKRSQQQLQQTTAQQPTSSAAATSASGGNRIFLNHQQLPQLNVASKAQSVTASVFTPISQLPNLLASRSAQFFIPHQSTPGGGGGTLPPAPKLLSTKTSTIIVNQQSQQQQQQKQQPPHLTFVSRSEDMNKGYLSFAEDAQELTMLKEEPDDLVHLAPTAVDACLPLDESTPLFGEMLVGLMSSYGSLLPDDINSLDSTASSAAATCHSSGNNTSNSNSTTATNGSNNNNSKGHIDPFINYREESNDTNCSQHLLSPCGPSKSPEASSLPSLCSPNSLSQEDEFAFMTMNVDDDIDLTMRAPYIPMNEQDDLPLLTDDLMWSAFSEELTIHKDDAMQFDSLRQQLQAQQQQQQHQSSCNDRILVNYHQHQQETNNLAIHSPTHLSQHLQHQQHQQQQQHHQQQHHQHQQQHQLLNSICSSPASSISSLSPSPPLNCSHSQRQHQQHHQNSTTTTNDYGSESSLAALLCCGSSVVISDDNDSGIGSIGNSMSPQQHQHHHHQPSHTNGGGDFKLQNLHQQLRQHQHHQCEQNIGDEMSLDGGGGVGDRLGLGDASKKDNFESATANLCDSIDDAFENVCSKDSSNLDCWSDLLQMNTTEQLSSPTPSLSSSSSTSITTSSSITSSASTNHLDDLTKPNNSKQQIQLQQLQQPNHPQNIIINTGLTTLHVPLNLLQSMNRTASGDGGNSTDKLIIKDAIISNNRKLTTNKLSAGCSSATATTVTTSSTTRPSNNNSNHRNQTSTKATIVQTAILQQQHPGNKRHLSSVSAAFETKRLKNSTTTSIEVKTSPHLLQQLMAPVTLSASSSSVAGVETASVAQQQRQRKSVVAPTTNAVTTQRWSGGDTHNQQAGSSLQQQQQSSNSVLKNLLISGCDNTVAAIETKPTTTPPYSAVPMIMDDCDDESIGMASPLHCDTSTAKIMRSFRSNPMIGGPSLLLSPTIGSDDSNPPGLTSSITSDSDSASDSGFDDASGGVKEKSLKFIVNSPTHHHHQYPIYNQQFVGNGTQSRNVRQLLSLPIEEGNDSNLSTTKGLFISKNQLAKDLPKEATTRTITPPPAPPPPPLDDESISFVDNINPLLTTFLMDLCNDDYNMNETDYLEDNEMAQVLNEWTNELA